MLCLYKYQTFCVLLWSLLCGICGDTEVVTVALSAVWHFALMVHSCSGGTCTRKRFSCSSFLSGNQIDLIKIGTDSTKHRDYYILKLPRLEDNVRNSNWFVFLMGLFSLLSVDKKKDGQTYLFLATVGHFSLFPLLFTQAGKYLHKGTKYLIYIKGKQPFALVMWMYVKQIEIHH